MSFHELAGRVAVISGASKGLGEAMALALADAGVNLGLIARDENLLQRVSAAARARGVRAEVYPADITSEEQVERAAGACIQTFGAVNILINNAGVNVRKPVQDFTLAEWRQVVETNLTGAFLLTRALVPTIIRQKGGRIINMASMMSHIALPGRTAYCASKAGLVGFTRALALEIAPHGATANAICPGPFATEMNMPLLSNPELNQQFISRIPVGRWGKVEDIGQLAVYLCSDSASFITGADLVIDGGWTAQ
ncbi:MAG TPA: SDR family oxidoreductase [Methylomirabilota bacterium]|nr:SDR family oxidoreductase [Methylomirabilota bacterium]